MIKIIAVIEVLFAILSITIMASCAPSPETHPNIATFTPVITATPITQKVNAQNISHIVQSIFKEMPECKSYNAMNANQDVLDFFDATEQFSFDRLIVHEIADSANNKYRAYLATDPNIRLENCELGCSPERVYIKDSETGEIHGINWNGYMPRRITFKIIWLGDEYLAFQQNINPYNSETIVIDIEQQSIIYRSLESCN